MSNDEIHKLLHTCREVPEPTVIKTMLISTQEPTSTTHGIIELIKKNCKTSYEEIVKEYGGEFVKLGEGGTTFDPCIEFSKLPEDVKLKLTDKIIKIIEKNEAENKQE